MIDIQSILGGERTRIDFKIFFYTSHKLRVSLYIDGLRLDSTYFIDKIRTLVPDSPTSIDKKEYCDTFLQLVCGRTDFLNLKENLINKLGKLVSSTSKTNVTCERININDLISAFEFNAPSIKTPKIETVEHYLNWKINL